MTQNCRWCKWYNEDWSECECAASDQFRTTPADRWCEHYAEIQTHRYNEDDCCEATP